MNNLDMDYFVYMIRCEDNSLYTGITTNIPRRMEEHFTQNEKCAKYTKRHKPIKLEAVWKTENRILASKLEYAIKTLKKDEKEKLILQERKLNDFFEVRLNCEEYSRQDIKKFKANLCE